MDNVLEEFNKILIDNATVTAKSYNGVVVINVTGILDTYNAIEKYKTKRWWSCFNWCPA